MVTALFQLHHDVNEGAVSVALRAKRLVVPSQDQLVVLPGVERLL